MNSMNIHHVTKVEQKVTRHESGAVWTTLKVHYRTFQNGDNDKPMQWIDADAFEIALFSDDSLEIDGRQQPVPFTIHGGL